MAHHNEEVNVNYVGTVLLSFVVVLCLFLIMANVHGTYKVPGEQTSTEQVIEK